MISPPELLTEHHVVESFLSGEESLDIWLHRHAFKNQVNGSSRTYVICSAGQVIGYYCLSAGSVAHGESPKKLTRNRPNPIPVLVLGRLAIAVEHQQKGIGTALLRDAILRTLQVAEMAGVSALLVHCISEQAKRFYLSRGFLESPIDSMTLFLEVKTARKA